MTEKPAISVPSTSVSGGGSRASTRLVPEEQPVALTYNGTTQAVMMATPDDLEDFAVGFTLSEGIAAGHQISRLDILEHGMGFECQMWLEEEAGTRLEDRRRASVGPVGCGLCGIDSLEQVMRPLPLLPDTKLRLNSDQINAAMRALRDGQTLHDQTRGVHAAGFLSADMSVTVREDVGRHNALDKLIGAMARGGADMSSGAVLLTSRVSVDMVQKTVMAGCPILIAVSAPTAGAVRVADDAGLSLVALAREKTFEIFTHPHRITPKEVHNVA